MPRAVENSIPNAKTRLRFTVTYHPTMAENCHYSTHTQLLKHGRHLRNGRATTDRVRPSVLGDTDDRLDAVPAVDQYYCSSSSTVHTEMYFGSSRTMIRAASIPLCVAGRVVRPRCKKRAQAAAALTRARPACTTTRLSAAMNALRGRSVSSRARQPHRSVRIQELDLQRCLYFVSMSALEYIVLLLTHQRPSLTTPARPSCWAWSRGHFCSCRREHPCPHLAHQQKAQPSRTIVDCGSKQRGNPVHRL